MLGVLDLESQIDWSWNSKGLEISSKPNKMEDRIGRVVEFL